MTHDELLVLLNAKSDSDEIHALRAVVDLHKFDQWGEECKHCDNGSYPCETIQAIEKELA